MDATDVVERAFLSALHANIDRPALLPFDEDVMDGYVLGFERAAYCIAAEFGRTDLIEKWMGK